MLNIYLQRSSSPPRGAGVVAIHDDNSFSNSGPLRLQSYPYFIVKSGCFRLE